MKPEWKAKCRVNGKPIAWRRPDMFVNVPAGDVITEAVRRCHTPAELRRTIQRLCSAGVRAIPNDHPLVAYKKAVQYAATCARCLIAEGPVCLRVTFWMPRPKAENWKTKPTPAYPHTKRPDADNLLKAIKDALNGIAYADDAQVAFEQVWKMTCAGGNTPFTVIEWGTIE